MRVGMSMGVSMRVRLLLRGARWSLALGGGGRHHFLVRHDVSVPELATSVSELTDDRFCDMLKLVSGCGETKAFLQACL